MGLWIWQIKFHTFVQCVHLLCQKSGGAQCIVPPIHRSAFAVLFAIGIVMLAAGRFRAHIVGICGKTNTNPKYQDADQILMQEMHFT